MKFITMPEGYVKNAREIEGVTTVKKMWRYASKGFFQNSSEKVYSGKYGFDIDYVSIGFSTYEYDTREEAEKERAKIVEQLTALV